MTFQIELDKQKFREWIESHEDGFEIGKTCSPGACPIAQWVNETQPIEGGWFTVTRYMIWRNPGDYHMALPDWASSFVGKLDDRFQSFVPVEKSEALDVLDTCEDES